jgi:hypothetical protein
MYDRCTQTRTVESMDKYRTVESGGEQEVHPDIRLGFAMILRTIGHAGDFDITFHHEALALGMTVKQAFAAANEFHRKVTDQGRLREICGRVIESGECEILTNGSRELILNLADF